MAAGTCSRAEAEAQKRFSEIHLRVQKLGLSAAEITKLASFKELQRASPSRQSACGRAVTAAAVCAVVTALAILTLLVAGGALPRGSRLAALHRQASELWMEHVMDADLSQEPCLWFMSEGLQDVFRPPVNCSACRHTATVPKLANLSQAEFERNYAYTARPLVVTDGMQHWSAQGVFSFEFFKTVYGKESPVLEANSRDCQFFPYRTDFVDLKEVFEMAPERANLSDGSPPWYIGW